MIIQCGQCKTKFKLDDSRVPDKGVKVRCAKCRSVFSVVREQAEAEPRADFGTMLDSSVASVPGTAIVLSDLMEPESDSSGQFGETPTSQETGSEYSGLFDDAPAEMQDEPEDFFLPDTTSEADEFFSVEGENAATGQPKPEEDAGEIDFGPFAFDEDDDAVAEIPPSLDFRDVPTADPLPDAPRKEEFGGLDFSGDDLFGEVVTPAPEEAPATAPLDFGIDDFADSMGVQEGTAGQAKEFSLTESAADAPFSLDEIDFGDELTSVGVQHVNPEELKPGQELLFAPMADAQSKPAPTADTAPFPQPTSPQEELPPLSIGSRRKSSSTGLIAVLGIVIAVVLGFFGYSMFSGDKSEVAQETGKISLSKVDATYVKNKVAGDLLVISGEAINNFSKPRAAIQIKGMIYGSDGSVVSSKNAFCGNPLTEEQLSTLSMEKIDAAMANQFGDSLANMEVAPGKAIPFVIVLEKPPAGAKDYGVEPAGSTVATGKAQ